MTIFVASCGAGKTACHIFKGGESQCIAIEGQKKRFVNIKVRLGFKKILHVNYFTSSAKENCQIFPVFHLIDPMNARSAPPASFYNRSHCTSLPSCIYLASSLH